MPISSFPISVRSSVNLSDINIDTDLDMGSNSIIGYTPSSSLSSLFKYFTYDKSFIPVNIEVINKPDEYTLEATTSYTTMWSETFNNTLNENIIDGRKYIIQDKFKMKGTNGSIGSSYAGYSFDNSTKYGLITKGDGSTYFDMELNHIIPYNRVLNWQLRLSYTTGHFVCTKEHTVTIKGYTPTTPISASNFDISKIIGIILPNANDKIKLNNDSALTLTQSKLIYLTNHSKHIGDIFDNIVYTNGTQIVNEIGQQKILDIDSLTQIDIIAGNPIFLII